MNTEITLSVFHNYTSRLIMEIYALNSNWHQSPQHDQQEEIDIGRSFAKDVIARRRK